MPKTGFIWETKKIITNSFIGDWRRSLKFKRKLKQVQTNHRRELKRIRKIQKIKVVFFVIHSSVWKYDILFRLIQKHPRFDPVIVICPYTKFGDDIMFKEMNLCENLFTKKKYPYINTYKSDGEWLNVKGEVNPDIVFFTNPWKLTMDEYYILNYLDRLTCYVPYGFKNSWLYQSHFNKDMMNLVWKFFIETDIHKKLSKKYSRNKGINAVVTGYPGMDELIDENYSPKDPWKIKGRSLKRIIWAPHHTIPGCGANLDYSTFLDYADFMLQIVESYKDRVQIAFKPHPVLRGNLSLDEVWGKEKTDRYYQKWNNLTNGMLVDSEYIDLFLTSDALIHDSSSFVIEYLYVSKPELFLMKSNKVMERFNEVGKRAFKTLYHGKNESDIIQFIENVVLNNNDIKRKERAELFNQIIRPPNHKSASENILNHLINELEK